MTDEDRIHEAAVQWHLASTQDDMDWDGFTAWLEADPRHRTIYDEVALVDDMVGAQPRAVTPTSVLPAPDPLARSPRRWRWAGAAIAASLVVAAVLALRPDPPVDYATAGQSRTIALADGSRIELAPHSHLAIAADGARVSLDGGAFFTIPHDPRRRLEVSAGPVTISDIGTRFDVQATGATARIAVAEGRVRIAAPALERPVNLAGGASLLFDGVSGQARLGNAEAAAIGGWRRGRLTYDETPLALVVADLGRYAGVRIAVPADIGRRRFSGTLAAAHGIQQARDLAELMDLSLVPGPGGYRLVAQPR